MPGKWQQRAQVSDASARPIHTVPTGLPGSAPPGPAMPVADTATSQPSAARAPSAMAHAVSSLTAPIKASVSRPTPNTSRFTSEE